VFPALGTPPPFRLTFEEGLFEHFFLGMSQKLPDQTGEVLQIPMDSLLNTNKVEPAVAPNREHAVRWTETVAVAAGRIKFPLDG
jgi:hypothetical protein